MRDPQAIYHNAAQDSRRWRGFGFRAGDIVITTPPKCGTTWMQRICSLLVFQTTELERPLGQISPWLDQTTAKIETVRERLEAQRHRRFIKTHTPLAGLPIDDRVQYVCVGRDPRDAGVSWYHHQKNVDVKAVLAARDAAVGNENLRALVDADPPFTGESLEERFWEWVDHPTPPVQGGSSLAYTLHHIEDFLAARSLPNVHVFHYAELKADLPGEMRRLAELLEIDVPESRWPEFVEAAGFETMKADAERMAPSHHSDSKVWKQAAGFFHGGKGGGWRTFFDEAAAARYEARVAELVSREVRDWAHR